MKYFGLILSSIECRNQLFECKCSKAAAQEKEAILMEFT